MSRSRLTGAGSNSENIPTTMLRRNGRKGHAPIFVRPARGMFLAGNKAQRSEPFRRGMSGPPAVRQPRGLRRAAHHLVELFVDGCGAAECEHDDEVTGLCPDHRSRQRLGFLVEVIELIGRSPAAH